MAHVKLDPVDLEILRQLQSDARISNRALAAHLGVASSTCSDRITRLRDAGVIDAMVVTVDAAKLGRPLEALLAVRLQPHRRPLVKPFVDHATSRTETRAVYHVAGPDDYLVHVAVADTAELQRVVLDEYTSRMEVARVHTMLIFERWDAGPLMPAGSS